MKGQVSSGARGLILERICDILGNRPGTAAAEYELIAREYQQSATLEEEERIAVFVERVQHYQVDVYRCERATLPRTISEVLAGRNKSRLMVPSDLPREWLPPDLPVLDDEALGCAELDRSEGVLTGCSLAIASTGTIVLRHQHAEGRRALTLVPDYHLCVVSHDQIVQTVPEAIRLLARWKPKLVTTISGPSATADIEMTRVRGVHGPRILDVIVLGVGG